jgi:hypothetical protein
MTNLEKRIIPSIAQLQGTLISFGDWWGLGIVTHFQTAGI